MRLSDSSSLGFRLQQTRGIATKDSGAETQWCSVILVHLYQCDTTVVATCAVIGCIGLGSTNSWRAICAQRLFHVQTMYNLRA